MLSKSGCGWLGDIISSIALNAWTIHSPVNCFLAWMQAKDLVASSQSAIPSMFWVCAAKQQSFVAGSGVVDNRISLRRIAKEKLLICGCADQFLRSSGNVLSLEEEDNPLQEECL